MKLKEFIEKYKQIYGEYSKYNPEKLTNSNYIEVKNFEIVCKANSVEALRAIAVAFPVEKITELAPKLFNDEERIQKFNKTIFSVIHEYLRKNNETNPQTEEIYKSKVSPTDKINSLLDYLRQNTTEEKYKLILTNFSLDIATGMNMLVPSDGIISSDRLEEVANICNSYIDKDIEVFYEEKLPPMDIRNTYDEKVYEEKINDIKLNNELTQKQIDDLNYDNEIITLAKEQTLNDVSQLAENLGKFDQKIRNENCLAYANTFANLNGKVIIRDSQITLDKELGAVNNQPLVKEFIRGETKFSENSKSQLLEIYHLMDETGILNDKEFMPEEALKEYSFKRLVEKRKEIQEAIDNKNFDLLSKLNEEYKKLDANYEKLMDLCKKMNPTEDIPTNVSSARAKNVPQKYRLDLVGASRLNGLSIAFRFLKFANIPVEEALDNIVLAYQKAGKYFASKDGIINKEISEMNTSDVINILDDREKYFKMVNRAAGGFIRTYQSILSMIPDSKEKTIMEAESKIYVSNVIEMSNNSIMSIFNFLSTEPEEKISNILLASKKDFDLLSFASNNDKISLDFDIEKGFNRKEYVESGKVSFFELTNRLKQVHIDFNAGGKYAGHNRSDLVNKSIVKLARELLEIDIVRNNPTLKEVYKQISNNRFDKILDYDIKSMEIQDKFKENSAKPFTKDNLKEAIKIIAESKKEYDKRNFFAKIFYKSASRQKTCMNNLINTLSTNGISKENINILVKEEIRGENIRTDALLDGLQYETEVVIQNQEPQVEKEAMDIAEQIEEKAAPEHEMEKEVEINKVKEGPENIV